MILVVADAIPAANKLGDARAGPQIRCKPIFASTFDEVALDLSSQGSVQFRRTPWSGPGRQTTLPFSLEACTPSPNRAAIYPDSTGHINRCCAILEHRDGADTPTLKFLWAARRSHGSSSAQSIGHSLCRNQ
jgi:hypothetical protein